MDFRILIAIWKVIIIYDKIDRLRKYVNGLYLLVFVPEGRTIYIDSVDNLIKTLLLLLLDRILSFVEIHRF